jgi:transposase
VPGQLVRLLGVGARGIKTDERDAEALAQASVRTAELPSVHLCSEKSRAQRQMIGTRALLLKARGSIARNIKTWLRGELIVVRGRASTASFCETVRKIALEKDLGLPLAIETMLDTFEHLTRQVAKLDEQIEAVVEQDAVCKKLMGVGGVGEKVSLAFTSQVDDPKRFRSADALASYLALVPGEATTGGKVKRTGAIKAGPKYLKALLVQAAWSMWRCRPNDPMVIWAQRIADKRGKRIAVIALARKLATVMWAIWRHDGTYDPKRAANIVPSGTS